MCQVWCKCSWWCCAPAMRGGPQQQPDAASPPPVLVRGQQPQLHKTMTGADLKVPEVLLLLLITQLLVHHNMQCQPNSSHTDCQGLWLCWHTAAHRLHSLHCSFHTTAWRSRVFRQDSTHWHPVFNVMPTMVEVLDNFKYPPLCSWPCSSNLQCAACEQVACSSICSVKSTAILAL